MIRVTFWVPLGLLVLVLKNSEASFFPYDCEYRSPFSFPPRFLETIILLNKKNEECKVSIYILFSLE